jgi:formate/nitrite transporter FocA (FNT family)
MARAEEGSTRSDAPDPPDAEGLSEAEKKDVDESSRLSALTIFEVLRREGEDEMDRPAMSLWWSGVAAGLSLSFSLIAQGVLQTRLPDAPWRPLVTSLGYTVGFLIAVMARHQLFTENTITAVLPVTARLSLLNLGRMGRLWGLVLIANLAGTLLAALFCSFTSVIPPELREAMLTISQESVAHQPVEIFFRAIAAGFLIAAMVWLLPSANATQFHVIILMTYLIAIGGFTHIVAGSFEGFMLVANARLQVWPLVAGFEFPTLTGNIIGGTVLFSLIAYGQVAREMGPVASKSRGPGGTSPRGGRPAGPSADPRS